MRLLALAAAAALTLAGCQTSQLDAGVQKSLPAICAAAETMRPVYEFRAAAGKITDRDRRRVDAAYAVLDPLCADPSGQTGASVLTAALAAYLTISAAAG